MNKVMGREPYEVRMATAVTPTLAEIIKAEAEAADITVSTWLRQAARQRLQHEGVSLTSVSA